MAVKTETERVYVFCVCVRPWPSTQSRSLSNYPTENSSHPLKSLFPSNQATKTRKLKHFGHTSRHNSLAKDIMLGPIVYYLFI